MAPPDTSRREGHRPLTVLFDLDGTLLDSIALILNSARHSFQRLEREWISDAEWTAGIGIPLFTMFRRYARNDAEQAEFIAGYREYQLANHDRLISCYDGVIAALTALRERGHELGIVTSKSEALAMRGLAHVRIAHFMDTVVGCDASSRHKPDPEPVRIALHRLACAPEHAVFVGDSVHDVVAGNAAGVRTIAALWGAGRRSEMAAGHPTAWAEAMSDVLHFVR